MQFTKIRKRKLKKLKKRFDQSFIRGNLHRLQEQKQILII